MSIIYNDTNEKSELQRKIAAELREKSEAKPLVEPTKLTSFDDTKDPDYSKDFGVSKANFWIGAIVAAIIVAGILFIVARNM